VSEDLEALEEIAELVRKNVPDGTRRALCRFPMRVKGSRANPGQRRPKVTLPKLKCLESADE
jgi:hypothetical protein